MISWLFRWLSFAVCLLLSWSFLVVPPPLALQPQRIAQSDVEVEKEAQLQSDQTLNKKKIAAPSVPLTLGAAALTQGLRRPLTLRKDSPSPRKAQIARGKILAMPVGRLAPPVLV